MGVAQSVLDTAHYEAIHSAIMTKRIVNTREITKFLFALIFLFGFAAQSITNALADSAQYTTQLVRELMHETSGPQLRHPSDVQFAQDGTIFVLDGVNNRVVAYNNEGGHLYSFGKGGSKPGQLNHPLGLAIDSKKNIYIADTGNARVQIFNAKGKYLTHIELPQAEEHTLLPDPTDLALDEKRQLLYVVDNDSHRLLVFNLKTKELETTVGHMDMKEEGFRWPFSIHLDSEGNIYIVDVINTLIRIIKPDNGWEIDTSIGEYGVEPGEFYRPKGVAVNEKGHVFISDSFLGVIQIFDSKGKFLSVLRNKRGGIKKFITPTRLNFDHKGRLYVVEMFAHRVSVHEIDQ